MNLLDFIFPKQCVSCGKFGEYICQKCKKNIIFPKPVCPICRKSAIGGKTHPKCSTRFGLDGLVFGCSYKGSAKRAILKLKYKWVSDIASTLVETLTTNLWQFNLPQDILLVPIPLHKKRHNWRGFNQAELFCELLSKTNSVSYKKVLKRVRETKNQVGLTRAERLQNIKAAFKVAYELNKNKSVVLVDDVFTTGATMKEACFELKKAGTKEVWAMVIALD